MADFFEFNAAVDLMNALAMTAAKGLAILLVVTLVCVALRRAPASYKHLCWAIGLGAVLALPLLSLVVPSWNVLPISSGESASPAEKAVMSSASGGGVIMDKAIAPGAASSRASAAAAAAPAPMIDGPTAVAGRDEAAGPAAYWWSSATWIVGIWALGAIAILLHMLFSSFAVWRIVTKARPVTDPDWLDALEEIGDRLSVRRPVQLLQSNRVSVPVAWGAIRPVILIPPDADSWSNERRRCVLAHEMAHVKRFDTLTQPAAHIACALHWFNPLVWKAARSMQLEREKACDDYVLMASRARASEYAGHLLEIARRLPGALSPPAGAIAMARRSQLEGRILAILEEGRRRSLQRVTVVAAIFAALLLVLPIAAMSPFTESRSAAAEPIVAEPIPPGTLTMNIDVAAEKKPETHGAGSVQFVAPRDVIERSFNVSDGGWLAIDTDHGNVELKSGSSGRVHVEVRRKPRGSASEEDFEVDFDQNGDKITVVGTNTVRNSGRDGVNVSFIVTVPQRFNAEIETAGGNISVENLDGRVKLNTSGGNLAIGRITGEVDAQTSGGNIKLDGSNANVVVNTSGGNISLGRVGGTVRATTSGGNINVDEVNGEITAKTSGGHITAHIARQPDADCLLRTSGGGITVYLAPGVAVDLQAETSAGHVETDVEVATRGTIKKDRLHGTINGGGPLLELDTSAGDIQIRRL